MPAETPARSAIDAARAIRRGTLTSGQLTLECIAAIDRREAEVGAWSYFDREHALRQAHAADARRRD
ncbi:MAG: amidase, partial [Alphaproteobacteria bacterium]